MALSAIVLAGCGAGPGSSASPSSSPTAPASPTASPAAAQAEHDGSPEAPLADALDTSQAHAQGNYIERLTVAGSGGITQWVYYDLEVGFQDRRVAMVQDPGDEPDADSPDLRLVIEPDRALMWNPGVEPVCGTPWVEISPDDVAAATGLPIDPGDAVSVPPLELISAHLDAARRTDGGGYALSVPILEVLPASRALLSEPGLLEALEGREITALVRLDGGLVAEVTADLSEVLAEALGLPLGEQSFAIRWTLQPGGSRPQLEAPSDVAAMSCMEG